MSAVIANEPPTVGQAVIRTTVGTLEVTFWAKEAPKAVRNFVGLALEGYYNDNIFHRVIPNFIAQTGDPSGTGDGGTSFYGEPFADELNQRIRFSRRGLLAMANSEKNANGSQFFITLAEARELDGKHTIFGKIVGDSIFNALKLGELDVDQNDRPRNPPKIISIEFTDNPMPDVQPRMSLEERKRRMQNEEEQMKSAAVNVVRKRLKKNAGILSFEEEDEDASVPPPAFKISSSHRLESAPIPKDSVIASHKIKPAAVVKKPVVATAPVITVTNQQPKISTPDEQEKIARLEQSIQGLGKERIKQTTKVDTKPLSLGKYQRRGKLAKGQTRAGSYELQDRLQQVQKAIHSSSTKDTSKGEEKQAAAVSLPPNAAVEREYGASDESDDDDDQSWIGHRVVFSTDQDRTAESERAYADYEVVDTRSKAMALGQRGRSDAKGQQSQNRHRGEAGGTSQSYARR